MKKLILILIYSVCMRLFLKIALGVKYLNRETLRKEKQFILVANHNSHLDTVTLMSVIPSSKIDQVHPVAASDYFGKSKFQSFLSKTFINALLIPRSKPEDGKGPDPLEMMCEALEKGKSLILFPEGSRGEPEVMQRFKRGIGLILENFPHIPVIPVYLQGLGKSLPKGDTILVPFNSTAAFGDVLKITGDSPEAIAMEVQHKIVELKEKI